jgi:hypothetical protein
MHDDMIKILEFVIKLKTSIDTPIEQINTLMLLK